MLIAERLCGIMVSTRFWKARYVSSIPVLVAMFLIFIKPKKIYYTDGFPSDCQQFHQRMCVLYAGENIDICEGSNQLWWPFRKDFLLGFSILETYSVILASYPTTYEN